MKCGCEEHYEKLEFEAVLGVSAKKAFTTLFQDESFFQYVHTERKDWDIKITPWTAEEKATREIRWMFSVNVPMTKVKETECVEVQTILTKKEQLCYVVDCYSKTPSLPYGDAFQTSSRFCITFVSKSSCRILITIGVRFFKNPMVKGTTSCERMKCDILIGIIRSSAIKGLSDYFKDWIRMMQSKLAVTTNDSAVSKIVATSEISSLPHAIAEVKRSAARLPVEDSSGIGLLQFLMILAVLALSLMTNLYQYRNVTVVQPSLSEQLRSGSIRAVYMKDLENQVLNETMVLSRLARDLNRRDRYEEGMFF